MKGDQRLKSFVINGGDTQAHKDVLNWIRESVTAQKPVQFNAVRQILPHFTIHTTNDRTSILTRNPM